MKTKKMTFLASFGSGLEYFDFVTFALLAPYLNTLFFPSDQHTIGLIKTFCLFAVGYLARPFGGIVFGMIGDTVGRKNVFLWVIMLMALSTAAIGFLPTYRSFGFGAPMLLLFFRIIQGLSFGAELPGALIFLAEHAKPTQRGAACGILIGTISIGNSLAGIICFGLTQLLSQQMMLYVGWRIPFFIGGLLALTAFFLRRHLSETPVFAQRMPKHIKQQWPLVTLLKTQRRAIFLGFGLLLFAASMIVVGLSLPAQLHLLYHYPLSQLYLATTIGSLFSIVIVPLLGAYSDKFGRKRLFLIIMAISIIAISVIFQIPKGQTLLRLWLFILGYQAIIALLASCFFTMLAERFPTSVRFTGYAFCYNIIYAIIGFLPALSTYFIHRFHSMTPLLLVLISAGVISFATIWMTQDQTGQPLIDELK